MVFLLATVVGLVGLAAFFGGLVLVIRLIHQPMVWLGNGAHGKPPFSLWVCAGWLLLAVLSGFEIYQSHSLSLFHQIIAGFAGFNTLAIFRLWHGSQNTAPAENPCSSFWSQSWVKLLRFTPAGVAATCVFALFVNYQMSQAIYQTVREHDYYKLTALRLCGGRLNENFQGKEQLRSDFSMAIQLNYIHWANRMLEAGLDPNLDATPQGAEFSSTLLSEAISRGRTAIVTDLIAHGADPHGYTLQSYGPNYPNWR